MYQSSEPSIKQYEAARAAVEGSWTGSDAVKQTSVLDEATSNLSYELACLRGRIETLQDRLSPVLAPTYPAEPGAKTSAGQLPAKCSLANTIDDYASVVAQMSNAVNSILARLAV